MQEMVADCLVAMLGVPRTSQVKRLTAQVLQVRAKWTLYTSTKLPGKTGIPNIPLGFQLDAPLGTVFDNLVTSARYGSPRSSRFDLGQDMASLSFGDSTYVESVVATQGDIVISQLLCISAGIQTKSSLGPSAARKQRLQCFPGPGLRFVLFQEPLRTGRRSSATDGHRYNNRLRRGASL